MFSVTTHGVAKAKQLAFWGETVRHHFYDMHGSSGEGLDRAGFSARMDRVVVGGLAVDRVVSQPYRVVRSGTLARRSPSEALVLFVLQDGNVCVTQGDRVAELRHRGDFTVIDAAQAYGAELRTTSDLTLVQVPHGWAGSQLDAVIKRTALPVGGRGGLAATAAATLSALRLMVTDRNDGVAHAAARNAVDLATAAVLERGGQAQVIVTSRASILAGARRFMLEHLADGDLTPAQVAAALPISERYLFSVFHDEGTTPAEWLKRTRLDRARDLLTSSQVQGGPTIQQVAIAVGLPRASHFSRLFREQFGMSPRQYRDLAAAAAPVGRPIAARPACAACGRE
ncbi:AraC-binding-like domain-containing protein [Quadrisphaera granulorum]|uniref:AraC-like protein n=1 Tax=Quadrisphaera granulorum TaxID=317664 RepID=A0A316AW64_9ACTN|nr:AraC family transcriptional regulator [Quadrisphaera granulorum]PWJ54377.1 AraC-like protein [Quadrisphaera granulorum]SZE96149.1 AraC-binding-like domain-containing protein [Quadrisphaera granulorum]